jgi:hypothetical protein
MSKYITVAERFPILDQSGQIRHAMRFARSLTLCGIVGVLSILPAHGLVAQDGGGFGSSVMAQVPLQIRGSRAFVDVMVNGKGPFAFGWDTGASGRAWVTRALVDRLNLPIVDTLVVSDGSGVKGRNADAVRIDTIALGNLSLEHMIAPVLEGDPTRRGGDEIYGILGFDFFREHVVTFDYPQRELRVVTKRLAEPDGKRVLSYRLENGLPHIPIDIAGLGLDASIDSGNIGGILLPLSLADRIPLRAPLSRTGRVASVFNQFDLFRSELDGNVHIGEATIARPVLFFSDLVRRPNIGRDVIRSFALTFDQANMRVQFQRPTN